MPALVPVPTYRIHDTTGDDLGTIEHPARHILCRRGWTRKPISNYYDEGEGKVWRTPHLVGFRSCPACGASCVYAFWGRAAAA